MKPDEGLRMVIFAPTLNEFLRMEILDVIQRLNPLLNKLLGEMDATVDSNAMLPLFVGLWGW